MSELRHALFFEIRNSPAGNLASAKMSKRAKIKMRKRQSSRIRVERIENRAIVKTRQRQSKNDESSKQKCAIVKTANRQNKKCAGVSRERSANNIGKNIGVFLTNEPAKQPDIIPA